MRTFKTLLIVSTLMVAVTAPASASGVLDQNCVGKSVSQLGVFESGLFWVLSMFGGRGIGEVASTHCDPSWD